MLPTMLYDLGLLVTVAICGWLALDVLASPGGGRRAFGVAALAAASGIWASGDLLIGRAGTPGETEWAFRIHYVGVLSLPVAWLAVSARAARLRWWQRFGKLAIPIAAAPMVFAYSTLYWGDPARFIDIRFSPPQRGPLFWAIASYGWGLIVVGWWYFARSAIRLRRSGAPRMLALAVGTLVPLVANTVYVGASAYGYTFPDPTAILLGFGALLLRAAIIDSGLALVLPLARTEVIEQIEIGILVADLDGEILDANWAARRIVGDTDVVGRSLDEVIDAVRSRAESAIEVRRFPLRSAVAIVGNAAFLADRSETQQAERRLALAARLEALGFLTAGIAHEVNNPLAFIRANLGQLEKLARELEAPAVMARLPASAQSLVADAVELVSDTQEGVERIAHLVSRLRRFAHSAPAGQSAPTAVDLGHVADAAVAMASIGLPAGAIRCCVGSAPPVHGMEGELVQIALNLLVNAVQASEGVPQVEVEVAPAEGGAVLCVRDRGCGISDDVMPRIFDPFFTTKPQGIGTGLGLSLSYDLARRNGGSLEAANRAGGGAQFTLWLPATSERQPRGRVRSSTFPIGKS